MKIDENTVRQLVEEPNLSRGKEYAQNRMLRLSVISPDYVRAKVVGSKVYEVNLWNKNSLFEKKCTCPAFIEFKSCKHIAAVCFALIKHDEGGYEASPEYYERVESFYAFKKVLCQKTRSELVSIIMDFAQDYPEIVCELIDVPVPSYSSESF